MNQLKTIIVGVDFSECSRCALEQAVRLARGTKAGLRLVHAIPPTSLNSPDAALQHTLETLRRQVRNHAVARLSDWAAESGAPPGHTRDVINGVPLDVLLTESRSGGADLLVLGVTGNSLLSNGAGTLATKCLRKSGTKVLLVNAAHAQPFRRIVACVDFSESSREAVAQAWRVAGQEGAEVHLLHVFQPEWRVWTSMAELPAWGSFEKCYREILEGNLRHFAATPAEATPTVSVCPGKTAGHGIAEYCREVDADLAIMGAKGQTNLNYVMLGSTVERLLKETPCSLLIVRPPAPPGGEA